MAVTIMDAIYEVVQGISITMGSSYIVIQFFKNTICNHFWYLMEDWGLLYFHFSSSNNEISE
jgi:hypothetical protein